MAQTALSDSARTADRIDAAGWRIVLLASLGGTLEFYDFVIFGVFARDIAQAIFPSTDPIVALMASFAAFAAGYLARPIGGIVLSHYGDRYGRRLVFLWSVFIMSGATLGMGLVPSYAQWGVAASALMVVLRLIQGFCLGGELPGALTYVVETAPRIAPFVCGVVFACVTMGVAVATGVSLGVRTFLDPELVPIYGWRIAFVLGGLGGVLSFVLRRSLEESPEFARMKSFAVRQPLCTSRSAARSSPAQAVSTACSSRTCRHT
jgi:MHS family proline/betaine transporter-like MFS transporter